MNTKAPTTVVLLLGLLLPAVANGFERQRASGAFAATPLGGIRKVGTKIVPVFIVPLEKPTVVLRHAAALRLLNKAKLQRRKARGGPSAALKEARQKVTSRRAEYRQAKRELRAAQEKGVVIEPVVIAPNTALLGAFRFGCEQR